MSAQSSDQRLVPIQLRPAGTTGEARLEHIRLGIEQKDVGLEPSKAPVSHFAAQVFQIVQRFNGRFVAHVLHHAWKAVRTAVRPVKAQFFPDRPPKKLVHRHPQRFAFDIDQRVFDGGDRLLRNTFGGLARHCVQFSRGSLMTQRIGTHHPTLAKRLDNRGQARTAIALVVLTPAHQAFVSGEFEKGKHAPARITVQRFKTTNLHSASPQSLDAVFAIDERGGLPISLILDPKGA